VLTFKICSLIFVTSANILIVLLTRIKHFQGREGKKEIFVKNLSWNTSDDSIKEYFGKYGNVTRVNILKRDDGKSKGIGFVCFEKAAEAQAAFDDASKIELDGRSISLNWANEKKERTGGREERGGYERRDRGGRDDRDRGGRDDRRERSRGHRDDDGGEKFTAFIGNLGYRTSERTIKEFFGDCGYVQDVRIAKQDGKSKGFCHVDFESREALDKAIETKQGAELDGRTIKIDESNSRRSGGGDRGGDRRGGRDRGGFRGKRDGYRGGRDRRDDD